MSSTSAIRARRGAAPGVHDEHAVHRHHRVEDDGEVAHKGDDGPRQAYAAVDPVGAGDDDEGEPEVEDQVDARVGDRHRQPGGHLPVDDAPVDRIEPSALIFHLGEGLDDPDANDVLPYHLHHAVDALLQLGVEGNALAGDGDDNHRQKRQRGEQQSGQHRFQREGDGDAPPAA